MRQGRDRARFLELGLLLLQLCSLFRSDGALIEGKNRRDTGQHQRLRREQMPPDVADGLQLR